jgi:hypothetical protein
MKKIIYIIMNPKLPYIDDIKKFYNTARKPMVDPDIETGYICAIIERPVQSYVYIGIIRDIHINKILSSLQKGNPRKLMVLRTFNRANYNDAYSIGSFFRDSLILNQEFGNWYNISPRIINRMFDEMFDTI